MYQRLIFVLILAGFLTGCQTIQPQNPEPQTQTQTQTPAPQNNTPHDIPSPVIGSPGPQIPQITLLPSIGGISLNDSVDKIDSSLGLSYQTVIIDEDGFFEEPYIERTYSNGLKIIIGKRSKKVLQIISKAKNMPTELGVTVGDSAETVLQIYRAKYTEPVSQHGAGTLLGWFEIGNGKLMIFDFNLHDDSMTNENITGSSQVERIILAYSNYMD